jgi:Calcineurin-like phosphoesterase
MIAQILNRQFVLDQLETIDRRLRVDAENVRRGRLEAEELELADFEEAVGYVERSLKEEREQSSGQPGFVPKPPERRGKWPALLDDFVFISRDPIISIVQSALEEALNRNKGSKKVVEQEIDDDRRRNRNDVPAVTARSLEGYRPRRNAQGRRIFDRFSITDIGWVSSKVAEGVRLFRKRYPFNDSIPNTVPLDDKARVILVGDWGTGIPRAQLVGNMMRRRVEEALGDQRPVHVVHLGDVYYSGFAYEYKQRFLPNWPVWPGEENRVSSWCLNGNHDMYCGGHAYFSQLLADPRFRSQGQRSFFRLANDNWQILGLDTAWDDNGLKDPQAEWVRSVLDQNPQKAIMLTHHQLFSVYEDGPEIGRILREKLGSVLNAERIQAAFWGHEHRCVSYGSAHGVKYGRLIGHGGVPAYMTHFENDPLPAPTTYEYRQFKRRGLECWALFGFAVLDFDGAQIKVRYIDENGTTHKQEILE